LNKIVSPNISSSSSSSIGIGLILSLPPGTAKDIFSGIENARARGINFNLFDALFMFGLFVFAVVSAQVSILNANNATDALTSIVTANDNTCVIDRFGLSRCWGYEPGIPIDGHGSILNVATIFTNVTIRSAGPILLNTNITAKSIHLSENAVCVLLLDGSMRCWGDGSDGILGDGLSIGSNTTLPSLLPPVDVGDSVKQIAMGFAHCCILLQSTSSVKCFGNNDYMQLGYNDTMSRGSTPDTVPRLLPIVPIGAPVAMICASQKHSCAVLQTTGDVVCWGSNDNAQLGYDRTAVTSAQPPLPRVPLAPGNYTFVSCGPKSTCAVNALGELRCFGSGTYGR
jgi:alpha-tubulin suppressor-like RCC1 family protein